MDSTKTPTAHIGKRAGRGFLGNLFLSFFFTLCVGAALVAGCAYFLSKNEDPARYTVLAGSGILFFTSLFAGLCFAKMQKRQGLLCGLTAGALFSAVLFLCSLFLGEGEPIPLGQSLFLHGVSLLLSILGGLLGGTRRVKAKRHRAPSSRI